jgi:hypothetical protein
MGVPVSNCSALAYYPSPRFAGPEQVLDYVGRYISALQKELYLGEPKRSVRTCVKYRRKD